MSVSLSPREFEVLRLVAGGWTYEQIARQWGVQPGTVREYGHRLMRKLGANSIAHAVHLAHVAGLLRPERHGDHAGYTAHLRRGERPCDACRAGERLYRNDRKALSASRRPEIAAVVAESTEPLNSRQSAA